MNFRGTKTTVLVKQQSSNRYKNNMVQKTTADSKQQLCKKNQAMIRSDELI